LTRPSDRTDGSGDGGRPPLGVDADRRSPEEARQQDLAGGFRVDHNHI